MISTQRRIGRAASALYAELEERVRAQLLRDFGLHELYPAGALMTRLLADDEIQDDEWEVSPGHVYWNAHVDQANIARYDYSALLYLANSGEIADVRAGDAHFAGGDLSFIDADRNTHIEPMCGDLLTFHGGFESLHRVEKVQAGARYVLAMWFTCARNEEYADEE